MPFIGLNYSSSGAAAAAATTEPMANDWQWLNGKWMKSYSSRKFVSKLVLKSDAPNESHKTEDFFLLVFDIKFSFVVLFINPCKRNLMLRIFRTHWRSVSVTIALVWLKFHLAFISIGMIFINSYAITVVRFWFGRRFEFLCEHLYFIAKWVCWIKLFGGRLTGVQNALNT